MMCKEKTGPSVTVLSCAMLNTSFLPGLSSRIPLPKTIRRSTVRCFRADLKDVGISQIPPRTSSAIACLGADTLNRVIPDFDSEANDFARKTQKLFVSQLEAVYDSSQHQGVAAVIRFLGNLHESSSLR